MPIILCTFGQLMQQLFGQYQGSLMGQGRLGEIIRGVGQLEDAVKAYQASLTALEAARKAADARIKAAQEKTEQARAALADAIVAEARAGVRQVDIIRRTKYSRERVRQILRAGGIEPD